MTHQPPRSPHHDPKRRPARPAAHPKFVALHERQRLLVVQSLLSCGRRGA